MNVWILRRLRAESRAWWYHRALRDRGEHADAASRERASIRSNADVIAKTLATRGAYVSTGAGGTTIHYARGCTLSSHSGLAEFAVAQILVEIGLPLVNTRAVADPWKLVDLPLVAVGRDPDPAPWTSLSYAPLDAYADRARALGAIIVNLPSRTDRAAA